MITRKTKRQVHPYTYIAREMRKYQADIEGPKKKRKRKKRRKPKQEKT